VGDMGIPHALVYYASSTTSHGLRSLYTASWIIWLFQGVLLTILGQFLIHHFLSKSGGTVLAAAQFYMCLVPVSLGITFHQAMLLGMGRVLRFNLCRLAYGLSYLIPFLISLYFQHRRIITILELYAVLQVVVLCIAACMVHIRPSWAFRPSKSLVFSLLTYGGKAAISNLSTLLNARLDQLVLSIAAPMREVGLYVGAMSYANVLLNLSQAAGSVAFSHAARAHSHQTAISTVTTMLKVNLALGLPLALAAEFVAPWIIPATLGRNFDGAVPLARIMLVSIFLLGFVYVFLDGMRGLGKPLDPAVSQLSGAAVMIAGLALLMPHPSAPRVAMVGLASASTSLGVAAVLFYRRGRASASSGQTGPSARTVPLLLES
jgi:O-antigen/teichoic acid export membrane protein